jgi:hypothetical protein
MHVANKRFKQRAKDPIASTSHSPLANFHRPPTSQPGRTCDVPRYAHHGTTCRRYRCLPQEYVSGSLKKITFGGLRNVPECETASIDRRIATSELEKREKHNGPGGIYL